MAGVFLPAGHQMTFTAAATKAGNYTLVGSPTSYTVLSAGSTASIGPFADPKQYDVNNLTYTQAADIVAEGDLYEPSAETNVAEIANDADGTEIATAVNGILAILVANGLMAAGA
jgi:hypothetical protein